MFMSGMQYNNDRVSHHGYHRFYPTFIEKFRHEPVKLLEIGVHQPEPFNMWCSYFDEAEFFGIEKDKIPKERWPFNCTIFQGDQSDMVFMHKTSKKIGDVDIIIDDGSHKPEHQLMSFQYLFLHNLKPGGVYIIEDIETSYWKSGELYGNQISAGLYAPNSIVNIFKGIVDQGPNQEFAYPNGVYSKGDIKAISDEIGMITFAQNCIIIVKKDSEYDRFDNRDYRFKHFTR